MSVPGPQHRGRPHRPALGEADRTGVGVLLDPLDLTLCPLPLQIAGVYSHPLPDLPHGTLDLAELERLITRGLGSPYHPVCELICLENTHSSSGGRVLPIEYLRQVGPLPPHWALSPQLLAPFPLGPSPGLWSPLTHTWVPVRGQSCCGRRGCAWGLQMRREWLPQFRVPRARTFLQRAEPPPPPQGGESPGSTSLVWSFQGCEG